MPSARLPASVAVLPFANRSVDSEYEYFADGITEDVIAHLTKIRSLKVISRTSVMTFNKSERNLREIGEKLGAATLPARNSVVASQAVMNIGEHGSFAESPVMSVPVVGGDLPFDLLPAPGRHGLGSRPSRHLPEKNQPPRKSTSLVQLFLKRWQLSAGFVALTVRRLKTNAPKRA